MGSLPTENFLNKVLIKTTVRYQTVLPKWLKLKILTTCSIHKDVKELNVHALRGDVDRFIHHRYVCQYLLSNLYLCPRTQQFHNSRNEHYGYQKIFMATNQMSIDNENKW